MRSKRPLVGIRMSFVQVCGDTKPTAAMFLESITVQFGFGEMRTSQS
jgi:hypothetical protein